MFSRKKFELIVPVFFGCLVSLFLSASLMMVRPDFLRTPIAENQDFAHETIEEVAAEMGNTQFFTQIAYERRDLILELYRSPESRERVIDFFSNICTSLEIVEMVLLNADLFNIPPALAFALAWEESRLNPRAVNTKNRDGSIDRGLFQLNNRSFPRLELASFYDPYVNSWYGMSHLRFCLDAGGSEVSALAMYNAGTSRVKAANTPKTTLDYASRILANRWEIENHFRNHEAIFQDQLEDFTEVIAEAKPERSILVPLMPLAGKK